jgi:hypothetical protein
MPHSCSCGVLSGRVVLTSRVAQRFVTSLPTRKTAVSSLPPRTWASGSFYRVSLARSCRIERAHTACSSTALSTIGILTCGCADGALERVASRCSLTRGAFVSLLTHMRCAPCIAALPRTPKRPRSSVASKVASVIRCRLSACRPRGWRLRRLAVRPAPLAASVDTGSTARPRTSTHASAAPGLARHSHRSKKLPIRPHITTCRASVPKATFLRRKAFFSHGIATLHAATGAPVWFAALLLQPDEGHAAAFKLQLRLVRLAVRTVLCAARDQVSASPRAPDQAGDQAGAAALMQAYANAVGGVIAESPAQYFWWHRRWRDGDEPD